MVISSYKTLGTGRATISSGTGNGISVSNCSYIKVTQINVIGGGRSSVALRGVYFTSVQNSEISLVRAEGYKRAGVEVNTTNNVRVSYVYTTQCGWVGIVATGTSHNVYIGYCVAHNIPGYQGSNGNTGNGIMAYGSSSNRLPKCLIEYCLADSSGWDQRPGNLSGMAGIWAYYCDSTTIQYCISSNNFAPGVDGARGADGDGFDLDNSCSNSVIQYCYSYDNVGMGYLLFACGLNNAIRYCVSENDGYSSFLTSNTSAPFNVYNNVFYYSGPFECVAWVANSSQRFENNIMILNGPGKFMDNNNGTYVGNCYWSTRGSGNWNGLTSIESWRNAGKEKVNNNPVGMFADPKLTNMGRGEKLKDPTKLPQLLAYMLQPNSPCINAGINLKTLYNIDMGPHDFYGYAIPVRSGYDIGAHEYGSQTPPFPTNTPPTCSFAIPANGASVTVPANISVTVNASDADGSVSKVDLYKNDVLVRSEATAPYNWNVGTTQDAALQNLTAGTYTLKAIATDNSGATTSSIIAVTVKPGATHIQINKNTLDVNGQGESSIQIINLRGQVVVSEKIVGNRHLSLDGLAPGVYQVRTQTARGIVFEKMVR